MKVKTKRIYKGRTLTIKDVPKYMYKLRPNCKDILRAWIKKMENGVKYHHANRESIIEFKRKRYKKYAKEICEETTRYYLANKEHLNKKNRECYWKYDA